MPRKDWFYVPLPIEQAHALDKMLEKEGKKYGMIDRTELIRIVLGKFIKRYETTGESLMDILQWLEFPEEENNIK